MKERNYQTDDKKKTLSDLQNSYRLPLSKKKEKQIQMEKKKTIGRTIES